MSRLRRLGVVLCLDVALIGGLLGVGVAAHSLGVLAESGDYLVDAAALAAALLATWLSQRPPTPTGPTATRAPRRWPRQSTQGGCWC